MALHRALGVPSDQHDRNRGQGLPSVVSDDGYRRLAAAVERRRLARRLVPVDEQAQTSLQSEPIAPTYEARRFASIAAVNASGSGFKRLASGCYVEASASPSATGHRRTASVGTTGTSRVAHPIWELRAAEEGEGFLLVRRKEERALDLRQAGAGHGTASAVEAGIVRTARARSYRSAAPAFLVSLLQTPDGSIQDRKTIFANEPMSIDDLERLVSELKLGPTTLTHDTWSDGEWELRVRGPKGQLIHDYESIGPDEIGGAKGAAMLDVLRGIIPTEESASASAGAGMDGAPDEDMGPAGPEAEPPMLGAGEAPGAPGAAGPSPGAPNLPATPGTEALAPSAAALKRGSRITIVRRGQIADAVVMVVKPQQQALEVMLNSGQQATVPMADVMSAEPMPDAQPAVDPLSGMPGDETMIEFAPLEGSDEPADDSFIDFEDTGEGEAEADHSHEDHHSDDVEGDYADETSA